MRRLSKKDAFEFRDAIEAAKEMAIDDAAARIRAHATWSFATAPGIYATRAICVTMTPPPPLAHRVAFGVVDRMRRTAKKKARKKGG